MAFTNIPNGNLQVGAPLRSVDILALRDNIPAVMNGDTGAPKIKAAAFQGQFGAAPVFAARAWVNFNGIGTVAIRASGNVSSITDNGVGDYTVNFATAMPNANYAAVFGGQGTTLSTHAYATGRGNQATLQQTSTTLRVLGVNGANAGVDLLMISVAIFR